MLNEEIDILKLYSGQISGFEGNREWNNWLTRCYLYDDINQLIKVMRGIQMGMASAEKNKLTNEKIVNTYCRWIGSIDKTIRRIMKKNKKFKSLEEKRQFQSDLENFLKRNMY